MPYGTPEKAKEARVRRRRDPEWAARASERDRARYERIKSDPVLHAEFLRKGRKHTAKYAASLKADPEKYAEHRRKAAARGRAYRERMKQDPERMAREAARRKEASRRTRYFQKYGITLDEYNAMLDAQGGVCAICERPEQANGRNAILSVDHCHESGRVRGLLCDACNRGIGLLGDAPERLRRALDYLSA